MRRHGPVEGQDFGLFPNVYFDIDPEWLDYFQVLPLAAGRALIRARSFGIPDDRR